MTPPSPPPPRFHRGRLPGLLELPHLEGATEPPALAQYLLQAGSRLTASSGTVGALGLSHGTVRVAEHPAVDRTCVIGPAQRRAQQQPDAAPSPGIPVLTSGETVALLVDAALRSIVVAGCYNTLLPAALAVSALAHLNPGWIVERAPADRAPGHTSGGDLLIAVLPSPDAGTAPCSPTVLVVTGVARAGADTAEMDRALDALLPIALQSQAVVVEHADLGARLLAERLAAAGHRRVITVGSDRSCDVRVVQAVWTGVTQTALSVGGEVHKFTLVTPGRRNALAAAAVFAAGLEIGADPRDLAASLTAFPGVPGFLTASTALGLPPSVTVLTSAARRPEEVADDLDSAFETTEGKVVVLGDLTRFRPDQAETLAGALAEASHVVLLAAPDDQQGTVTAVLDELARESVTLLRHGPCEPAPAAALSGLAADDDLVLLLGPVPSDREVR